MTVAMTFNNPTAGLSAHALRRRAAFVAAQRHTRHVRFLRRAIPVVAVTAVLGLIVVPFLNPLRGKLQNVSIGAVGITGGKVRMETPKLSGYRKDNRPYQVTAENAYQAIRNPTQIELQTLLARIQMEREGWVEIRTGSGVYVLDRSHRTQAPTTGTEWGPLEIIRARRMVEGETAATAAQHGKRKDVDAMRRAIRTMRETAARNEVPHEGDRAFHLAIVNACGNVVLTETVQGFWESRHGPIFARMIDYFETMESWQAAIGEHEAILDAIAARDAAAARDAMHQHMDKFHQRFSASWRRAKAT